MMEMGGSCGAILNGKHRKPALSLWHFLRPAQLDHANGHGVAGGKPRAECADLGLMLQTAIGGTEP